MTDDRELEALLRRTLAEQAGRVEPAGDGLSRIRARTRRRRGLWSRWSVPALALAGAAAVIVGIAVLPSVRPLGDGPSLPPGARSSAPATAPTSPPAAQATIPGAGVVDMATVWPYPTRREGFEKAAGDIAAGTYGDLSRPDYTAVAFVESVVGPGQRLTATPAGRHLAGLRMEVKRGATSVSLVYLVRVRVGDDAPYVVVNATRSDLDPSLTLSTPPRVAGSGGVVARGTVRRDEGEPVPVLNVELRQPGRGQPLARQAGTVVGPGPVRGWSARLVPSPAPDSATAAVVAWTADAGGRLLEFVAAPTAP